MGLWFVSGQTLLKLLCCVLVLVLFLFGFALCLSENGGWMGNPGNGNRMTDLPLGCDLQIGRAHV